MKSLSELKEIQSVLRTLSALAHGRWAGEATQAVAENQATQAGSDALLKRLDIGLHPICVVCGERIGIEELRDDPAIDRCRYCAE